MSTRASAAVFVLLFGAVLYCAVRDAVRIQSDIEGRTTAALITATMPWASVRMDGRTVTLVGVAPTGAARLRAARVVASVRGVDQVNNRIQVAGS